MKKTIKIGLLGCGTVGGGVIIVLNENKEDIARKTGCAVEVKTVLVRDKSKLKPEIEKYSDSRLPAIILIPSKEGASGNGLMNVRKAVERAVGADILFGGDK